MANKCSTCVERCGREPGNDTMGSTCWCGVSAMDTDEWSSATEEHGGNAATLIWKRECTGIKSGEDGYKQI